MVRFRQNALVVEIPCQDMGPAEYYEGLQNALYDVFWLATSKGQNEPGNGVNWIAAYLGPALAELEPSAKAVLNQLAQTEEEGRPLRAEFHTNEEILALLRELPVSRFEWLLTQLQLLNK